MNNKQIKAIDPTSYSHIKAFETCPKQFYHSKHLNEYPFVETEAVKYGKEMHTAAELYIRDDEPLPKRFEYLRSPLEALKRKSGKKFTELKLGVTHDITPCTYFSKDIWLRGVVDLLIIDGNKAWVIDYKSSKKSEYAEKDQLELMALLVFASYTEVEEIYGGLMFPRINQMVKSKYYKKDKAKLWSEWINRNNKMKEAYKLNKWATKPSGLCRAYCPVTHCVHNGANN
jgi:CRISPR/Cas system-associated exonuclease Cas4 (RecB family)